MVTTLGVVTMLLVTAASPDCATDAATPSEERWNEGRVLNGHIFMPTDSQPFAVTSFASTMLLIYGNTSSSLIVGGVDLSTDLKYAGTGGVLRYEYSFLKHFSVRAGVGTIIFSGIDGRSALAVGASVVVGVEAGATATLLLAKTVRVSLLFDFNFAPNIAITIGTGISAILASCAAAEGCTVTPGGILSAISLAKYRPALAAAWSPWRPLGLTAFGGLTVATSNTETLTTSGAINVGAAVDFDLMPLASVPVGLQVHMSGNAPVFGNALQSSTDLGGGVFYTGKKELSVGGQFTARRFAVRENVNVAWGYLATIGLRYYW